MPEPQPGGRRARAGVSAVDARHLARFESAAGLWALVRHAVADRYVLVTNDRADFTLLMEREPQHPGLVCITVAHGLMSLDVQTRPFDHALNLLAGEAIAGRVLEVALRADRTVRFDLYAPSTR